MLTYQVGDLLNIDPADPEIPDEGRAVRLALAESGKDDKKAFGVWTGQNWGSELVAIAFMGELFRK